MATLVSRRENEGKGWPPRLGAASSVGDTQWHNKLSVEQTLLGPLKLTTSVEDAGTTAPKKSITAGFKRTW